MFDVLSIGIIVADVIAKPVNELPETGKLEVVDKVELYTGGCAASAAIDMSRLGLNVAIAGKVGNDGFGKFMCSALKGENINLDGIKISQKIGTSASVATVNAEGERSFLHSFGANGELSADDIDFDIVADSKIVLVAGTMLMPTFDGEQCASVLKRAKEMGKYTVLDTAWDSKGRWMDLLRPCMEHIDLFIPSVEEAQKLSGKDEPEEMADLFISMGVKLAVIKLGKDGCFIKSAEGEKYFVPAYKVDNALDTTGAGDSFVSGFLTGMTKGWGLYECGQFANAVGANCVMAYGASTGIHSFSQIQEFIENHKGQ